MAERLVAGKQLPPGTFLIRERESDNLEYALTIRDIDQGLGVPCAKHYKIKEMENECGFYITKRMIFPSLEALVSYYSGLFFYFFLIPSRAYPGGRFRALASAPWINL